MLLGLLGEEFSMAPLGPLREHHGVVHAPRPSLVGLLLVTLLEDTGEVLLVLVLCFTPSVYFW